jgi:tRNA A-37 threonylcarbamoyl transferase component Bud32
LEDKDFARQLQTRGFASHPFLLVMAAGDRCLAQIIDHEREVPDWYEEAVRCARQVASSLAFFHSRGSIHGDLKPRNIVRIGTRYFLIDFDRIFNFILNKVLRWILFS